MRFSDPSRVCIARNGRHELTNVILSRTEVQELVERMLKSSGRRIDLSQPFVDAMLPQGHRLHVVLKGISCEFAAVNLTPVRPTDRPCRRSTRGHGGHAPGFRWSFDDGRPASPQAAVEVLPFRRVTVTGFDLEKAFAIKQTQLLADLGAAEAVRHPSDKGDISEGSWRNMLTKLLPRRYGVSMATVVDCLGGKSDAIDVVIHDRHFSPLVFWQDDVMYVPAESVYAVFECKPALNKDLLLYGSGKADSVRKLHRTSARPVISVTQGSPMHGIFLVPWWWC
jgi:hypothetical protein